MKSCFLAVTIAFPAALSLSLAPAAQAQVANFTFEAPQFTAGQQVPILNAAPNSGDASILASFTSDAATNGFIILNATASPAMSGQTLIDPAVGETLTISFNQPITGHTIDWAENQLVNDPVGTLRLVSANGMTNFAGANVGGSFQGGHVSLSGFNPITNFQLTAFDPAGARIEFALDNLSVTTAVPEPGSPALLTGLGVSFIFAFRRLRRRKTKG
jgi:hypothetical protein